MKKFLAALLVTATLVVSASAETLDLDSMSLEQLLTLQSSVQQLIEQKTSGSELFPEGTYVVGKDIKAGNYIFTVVSAKFYDSTQVESSRCCVTSRSAEGQIIQYSKKLLVGDLVYLSLSDGMTLSVEYGYGMIAAVDEPFGK